jgi:hypothetical protein
MRRKCPLCGNRRKVDCFTQDERLPMPEHRVLCISVVGGLWACRACRKAVFSEIVGGVRAAFWRRGIEIKGRACGGKG